MEAIFSSFKSALEQKKSFPDSNRELLVKTLNQQYKDLSISNPVQKNIASLSSENTFTITTGQQLHIFSGPLYFIYKTFSTINLAEELNKVYPGNHFVPVFWLEGEDHDFDEIKSLNIFDKELTWNEEVGGPVGYVNIKNLTKLLPQLKEIMGEGTNAGELNNLFDLAYQAQYSLQQATQILLHELFKDYGLVVLNPADSEMKKLFSDITFQDITENHSYKLVNDTINQLEKNYKVQAKPREINYFYMTGNFRERIVSEEGVYKVMNTDIKFTEAELKNELSEYPERFSPNVLMRPLFQETILPNVGYVGGGAEIAYWAELKSTFEIYGIPYPVLLLRNSLTWINKSTAKKLRKLDVKWEKIFLSEQDLKKEFTDNHISENTSLKEEISAIRNEYEKMAAKASKLDPTLNTHVMSEAARTEKDIKHLEKKLEKVAEQKIKKDLDQLTNIKSKLFPNGGLQERTDNFIAYYLDQGKGFFNTLKQELDPLEKNFIVLVDEAE